MAFGLGFSGGFADLVIEEPAPPTRGGGGGLGWRFPRLEPWTPPTPPPPPQPVKVRVTLGWPWILATASVTTVSLPPVTMLGGTGRLSARLVGPPLVVELHKLDRRSREAQELAEIGMCLAYMQARW